MTITTPKYGITAPSPATKMRDLGAGLADLAYSIEAALSNFDYDGQDAEGVTTQLHALKSKVSSLQDDVIMLQDDATRAAYQCGTRSQRLLITPAFGQLFQETDNEKRLYIGGSSGVWRQSSGLYNIPSAAWDASVPPFYGRTLTFMLPLQLESTETLAVTADNAGTGFNVIQLVGVERQGTATRVTARLMQFANAQPQAAARLLWQIVSK